MVLPSGAPLICRESSLKMLNIFALNPYIQCDRQAFHSLTQRLKGREELSVSAGLYVIEMGCFVYLASKPHLRPLLSEVPLTCYLQKIHIGIRARKADNKYCTFFGIGSRNNTFHLSYNETGHIQTKTKGSFRACSYVRLENIIYN
jgi:hypothetical protein